VAGGTIAALSRPSPTLAVSDWIGRKNQNTQATKRANPALSKQAQAPRTLLVVRPQPLGQILKRHQYNRIVVPHQR
jgi:hypothetical protein